MYMQTLESPIQILVLKPWDSPKMMKKNGEISGLLFRDTWTAANKRGINRYVAAE